MLRFVVAPDSFKGSLTSLQAGTIISAAIRNHFPEADIDIVPMADGGEGTVEALVKANSGRLTALHATGPLGDEASTFIGIIHDDTVVIETANIAGLTMVPASLRNPYNTTSKGVGELIRQSLNLGFRKFIVGLGGSATNDGGMGCLHALGVSFKDASGTELQGFGRELEQVAAVDFSGLDPRLAECELLAASDVTNPLCGPEGASYVFGPQKGATPSQIKALDAALLRYAQLVEDHTGDRSSHEMPGAGAAGGLGFALLMIGFRMISGAQLIEQAAGLQAKIAQANWVVTGEGRTDGQSLYGKLPLHVAKLAKQHGAKAILISGSLGPDYHLLREHFSGCFALVTEPSDLQTCMNQAPAMLASCSDNVMGFLKQAMDG
ncbi:glycerate kinase [Cohnella pontilimi]|uniref:Glycerate kinase n=1 Tax=Cohnella pontilimi TaxID=2564100 RepID=A0A4U0FEY9_9BACL|nr:glycerate kinase [Cohnella pontilimi]TJY42914.1 glycerate kinase [Cohnella pontilimi]